MQLNTSRRGFLQASAATGIGFWVAGGLQTKASASPNERVAVAAIGVGGRGTTDLAETGKSADVVALCDIDKQILEAAARGYPKAKTFSDYRKLFDEMGKSIDAVTVTTPDHMHAVISLQAMRMGKACYCQKPLTRTIAEAREMAEVAKAMGVVTQMGNQGTAESSLRKAAALLRKGVVGKVKEVHVWTNRPVWPQGIERAVSQKTPADIDWNLWLGVAPLRPYADGYHPFKWRGWWDFGCGALGDMACHTMNMPYMGLDMKNPTSVQALTSGHNGDSYPGSSQIEFQFPANDWRPGLTLNWYDGGRKPNEELMDEMARLFEAEYNQRQARRRRRNADAEIKPFDKKTLNSGCIVVGDKTTLFAPGDYAEQKMLLSGGEELPDVDFEVSPGHFIEFIQAIQGGKPARSNFVDYSGGLTETILLGNLAVYAAAIPNELGPKVEWDAKDLKCTNIPELMSIVVPTYRREFELPKVGK